MRVLLLAARRLLRSPLQFIRNSMPPALPQSGPDRADKILLSGAIIRNSELELKVQERTAELALRTVQLEQRTHQLEAFSYSVSHDLRAPLRAISGFAHILAQRHSASLDEKGRHFLDNILEASAHMSQLIDDMLNYSRLGRAAIVLKPTNLHEILEIIERNVREHAAEVDGTVVIETDFPLVLGDRTLLSQMFTNLIDNALTYRRAGVPPRVVVSWTMEGDEVVVSVADNGIGIEQQHFGKIFQVFQRLHGQDEYPGTGIGLSVVEKAAELQDARVALESQLGVGTVFRVYLQVAHSTVLVDAVPG